VWGHRERFLHRDAPLPYNRRALLTGEPAFTGRIPAPAWALLPKEQEKEGHSMDYNDEAPEPTTNQRRWLEIGLLALVAVVAAAAVFAIFGLNRPDDATMTAIADHPEEYAGDTVTLVGEIDEQNSDGSFTLSESGIGGAAVLVVAAPGETERVPPATFADDARVQVVGTVQVLDADTPIESVALAPDTAEDWDGKPIVIASAVTSIHPIN
jgi:hypothetical protein